MGAKSSTPTEMDCELQNIEGLLERAKRARQEGRWKEAEKYLTDVTRGAQLLIQQQKPAVKRRQKKQKLAVNSTAHDVWCTGSELLVESGRLWNSLMRMDKAVSCLEVGRRTGTWPTSNMCPGAGT